MPKNIPADPKINLKVLLYRQLFNCELMFDYLIEKGKKVPDWIGSSLSSINLKTSKLKIEHEDKIKSNKLNKEKTLELQLKIADAVEPDKDTIAKMLNELTMLCQPATPCSLENTIPKAKLFGGWGPMFTPFIRDIWLISIICLVGYVIFSYVNASYPDNIIYLQLLLMFSAFLGACFYTLNTAKRYVLARTFDDYYIANYYSRIIIGVIAGIILANIIKVNYFPTPGQDVGSKILFQMTPSLFALLGGFSAEAVVKILNRLVAMLMTLVEGETKDVIENQVQEFKNKMAANNIKQKMINVDELYSLFESPSIKTDEIAKGKIKEMINKLLEGK